MIPLAIAAPTHGRQSTAKHGASTSLARSGRNLSRGRPNLKTLALTRLAAVSSELKTSERDVPLRDATVAVDVVFQPVAVLPTPRADPEVNLDDVVRSHDAIPIHIGTRSDGARRRSAVS